MSHMRHCILLLTLLFCSCAPPSPLSKEELKPTVRELGGGHWHFDRNVDGNKNPLAANEALQECLSNWCSEHTELDIKMIVPVEFHKNNDNSYSVTSILVIAKRKK